jgi:hypothetical protein
MFTPKARATVDKAIAIVFERPTSSLNRGLLITLKYAIEDHREPTEPCDGTYCSAVEMAQDIIAGKF